MTSAAEDAGTYKPFFAAVVDTLAGILERRDEAERIYKESGSKPVVEHVGKGGTMYMEQNPALRLINDLNRDALAYWRDLGLTPAGYKKLNAEGEKIAAAGFERLLEKLM